MYFTCNIPFTNQAIVHCSGTLTDVLDTSSSGYFHSCSVPYSLDSTFLACTGVTSSSASNSLNSADYLSSLDSYAYSAGSLDVPLNYQSVSISTLQAPVGSSALLETLTPDDFRELSVFVTTVLILAFGIRIVRSMFVQTR